MPARSFWAFGRCAVAHTAISSCTAIGGPGYPCRVVWAIEEDATEVETVTPESAGRGAAGNGAAVPSVRLANVTKRFRDVVAVDDLSLDIERGEFFTLLGPSGCGKTTTLRMVAGFEEPSEGDILIDGESVEGQPAFKRPTNTVFQSYALFPHLSVEENIAFGLRRQGMGKSDARTRVAEELQRVGLAREAKRKPRQLSGGQQQRVALARALVNRPAVLLLDEPLGALDLKLRKNLQVELKRIQMEVGITFIYVTHDQEEALTMSDRIAVMNRGVVEQVDIPEVVYDSPRTTFVAGFIGVSNLMPGVAGPVSGGGTKLALDSGVTVWAAEDAGVSEGERVYAVVRPEKLQVSLVEEPAPSDRPSVEGLIESSLYLGTATQMVVRLPDEVTMTVLVPNTSEAERQRLPGAGARVRLSWTPDHMHVVKESTEPEPGVES
jgi:spermidine/putrescine transport system ATP-binding protein